MTLRLALVGCGEHSRGSHAAPPARYAARHPDAITLAAACDLDLERAEGFRRDFGFARAYAYVEDMLARERLDGCVTVMPVGRIFEMATTLLERRIPCVIEKSLGTSHEEVVEFVGALQAGRHPAPTVEDILPSSRLCFRIAEEVAQLPTDG